MKPICHLDGYDVRRMATQQLSNHGSMMTGGMLAYDAYALLQNDINGVFERRSAACAYEQERARKIVLAVGERSLANAKALFVTLGNPRCRLPIGALKTLKLRRVFRKWKKLLSDLRMQGWQVRSVAVVEVHLVKPLDGDPYWEPHVHGILVGAPGDAVRALSRVRPDASCSGRKRHCHVKAVSNLAGALSYATKFRPQSSHPYTTDKGTFWADNDLRGEPLAEWTKWMALYKVADLLTYRGIDLRQIGLAGRSEMATQHRMKGRILP